MTKLASVTNICLKELVKIIKMISNNRAHTAICIKNNLIEHEIFNSNLYAQVDLSNIFNHAKINPGSIKENIVLNFSVIIGKDDIKQLERLAKYKEDIEIIEKENETIAFSSRHENVEIERYNNELDKGPISSRLEKIGESVDLDWEQFKIYIQRTKDMPIYVGLKLSSKIRQNLSLISSREENEHGNEQNIVRSDNTCVNDYQLEYIQVPGRNPFLFSSIDEFANETRSEKTYRVHYFPTIIPRGDVVTLSIVKDDKHDMWLRCEWPFHLGTKENIITYSKLD